MNGRAPHSTPVEQYGKNLSMQKKLSSFWVWVHGELRSFYDWASFISLWLHFDPLPNITSEWYLESLLNSLFDFFFRSQNTVECPQHWASWPVLTRSIYCLSFFSPFSFPSILPFLPFCLPSYSPQPPNFNPYLNSQTFRAVT